MNSVNLGWLVFYYYGKLFFLKVGDWVSSSEHTTVQASDGRKPGYKWLWRPG